MSFTTSTLNALIQRHFPDLPEAMRFEAIRTGKFNSSYWVRAGETEMVLRIAPPEEAPFVFYERYMMRQEPELHALLHAETNLPVAEILAFDDSHALIDRDYLIMERLPGRPLTEMRHVDYGRVLWQVGEWLAEVHRLQAGSYGYLGAHHPMQPQPTWLEAFQVMWNKMIDDIADIGYYDTTECDYMRALLDERLALFDREVPSSLLHMDIWHQNILVDERGVVTGIVDWDRALWGDPEIEFAVLDYCGISEPPFWGGYGQERDRSPQARQRNIFYLLYEIQKYILIRHGRSGDPASARNYKRQTFQIAAGLAQS
jgi:aminoglycoside phosphotransferase (APT) family kinase protein